MSSVVQQLMSSSRNEVHSDGTTAVLETSDIPSADVDDCMVLSSSATIDPVTGPSPPLSASVISDLDSSSSPTEVVSWFSN